MIRASFQLVVHGTEKYVSDVLIGYSHAGWSQTILNVEKVNGELVMVVDLVKYSD